MTRDLNRRRAVLALTAACWLAACSAAWRQVAAPRHGVSEIADTVGDAVADATILTPQCRDLAKTIIEAGIWRRSSGRQGTRTLSAREAESFMDWDAARCPDRSLPAIAYGVIDGVRRIEAGPSPRQWR